MSPRPAASSVISPEQSVARAREVLDIEARALLGLRDAIGDAFHAAVVCALSCLDAGRKIVVTGIGKNLHIAQKISATLASTGSSSVTLNPAQALHGDLGILSKGDMLLVLSYSGASEELLSLLPAAKRLGVRVVSFTGDASSDLARCSDVVVPVRVEREACPFNMAPTASTTAALAVGDALALVLLDARGFRVEDYAKLHPAGAIGRSLLLRVSDIMRTGERLAVVGVEATVRDAVCAMTRARAGSAAVVDRDGLLKGIFTDGDLRRRLNQHADVLGLPIAGVMSASPVTVQPEQLAAEVLDVFEAHDIDDVLVVNGNGRLIGAVDIQDLPKFKIL